MKIKNNCDLRSCYLCRQRLAAWLPAIEGNRQVYHLSRGGNLFEDDVIVTGMFFIY